MRKIFFLSALIVLFGGILQLKAQDRALRVNFLGLAVGNLNLDYSWRLKDCWTLHIEGHIRPFDSSLPMPDIFNSRLSRISWTNDLLNLKKAEQPQNVLLSPGVRYWFCGAYNRSFFLSAGALSGIFRYKKSTSGSYLAGWVVGGYLGGGYSHELAPRWNLEAELTLGGLLRQYYLVDSHGIFNKKEHKVAPIISRVSVGLTYLL